MSKKTKVQSLAPVRKKKSTGTQSKASPKSSVYDPVSISKWVNHNTDHFIIYPTSSGYHFALFCKIEKTDPFEIIAVSPKTYKLKSEAVRAMKIMLHTLGGSSMSDSYIFAFDHKGEKISLKIQYDVKKLL